MGQGANTTQTVQRLKGKHFSRIPKKAQLKLYWGGLECSLVVRACPVWTGPWVPSPTPERQSKQRKTPGNGKGWWSLSELGFWCRANLNWLQAFHTPTAVWSWVSYSTSLTSADFLCKAKAKIAELSIGVTSALGRHRFCRKHFIHSVLWQSFPGWDGAQLIEYTHLACTEPWLRWSPIDEYIPNMERNLDANPSATRMKCAHACPWPQHLTLWELRR